MSESGLTPGRTTDDDSGGFSKASFLRRQLPFLAGLGLIFWLSQGESRSAKDR